MPGSFSHPSRDSTLGPNPVRILREVTGLVKPMFVSRISSECKKVGGSEPLS